MAQEIDPYRPPKSNVALDDDPGLLELASTGSRFLTFLIDYVCIVIIASVLVLVIAVAFGRKGIAAVHGIPNIVSGNALLICYYLFFESIWARTPGKLIFGNFVVNEADGKPSPGQVFMRTLCRLTPFEPFSFFGKGGWHDRISKTRVVRKRKP